MQVHFNEKELTQYLDVVTINRNLLPPRENTVLSIPKRHGVVYQHHRYTEKIIEMNVVLYSDTLNEAREAIGRILDVSEPVKLVFSDQPDRYWLAVPDGEQTLEETLKLGEGVIRFLAVEPFAYAKDMKEVSMNNFQQIIIDNKGSAPAHPIFTFQFMEDTSLVAVTNNNKVVQVGHIFETGDPFQLSNLTTSSYNEWLDTAGNFNKAEYVENSARYALNINNGVVTPPFTKEDTEGEGAPGWTGRMIGREAASNARNFTYYSNVQFKADEDDQLAMQEKGQIEFIFTALNEEAKEIPYANIIFKKIDPTGRQITVEFWVGEELIYTSRGDDTLYDFDGNFTFEKRNNVFSLTLVNRGESGQEIHRVVRSFTDTNLGMYRSKRVLVGMTFWRGFPPMTIQAIDGVQVRDTSRVQKAEQQADVFHAGDELVIDMEQGEVFLNGRHYSQTLDIGSQFFPVGKGKSTTGVMWLKGDVPYQTVEPIVKAAWRERFI